MARWDYLVEMDNKLRKQARMVSQNPGDRDLVFKHYTDLMKIGWEAKADAMITGEARVHLNYVMKGLNRESDLTYEPNVILGNPTRPEPSSPYQSYVYLSVFDTQPQRRRLGTIGLMTDIRYGLTWISFTINNINILINGVDARHIDHTIQKVLGNKYKLIRSTPEYVYLLKSVKLTDI